MAEPRWKKIVDDLLRLAQDDGATPDERATARSKIDLILERHPQAQAIKQYAPVREFTLGDLRRMKQRGISADGRWEGTTLEDAIQGMVADYAMRARFRLGQSKKAAPRDQLEGLVGELEATLAALQ